MAEQKYIQAVYEGRASYLNVFEPHAMSEGDPPMYSLCLIIPKSDKETITRLYKAVEAAKEIGKKQLWGGVIPEEIGNPIHDGNVGRPKDPNYKDCVSGQAAPCKLGQPYSVPTSGLYSGNRVQQRWCVHAAGNGEAYGRMQSGDLVRVLRPGSWFYWASGLQFNHRYDGAYRWLEAKP